MGIDHYGSLADSHLAFFACARTNVSGHNTWNSTAYNWISVRMCLNAGVRSVNKLYRFRSIDKDTNLLPVQGIFPIIAYTIETLDEVRV